MSAISLKYGLLCGLFLILLYFLSFWMEINPFTDVRNFLFNLIIFGVFIFFASKEYKTYLKEGVFHFWEGMSMGFLVYSIASLVFVLGVTLHFQFDLQLLQEYKQAARELLLQQKEIYLESIDEKTFNQQLEEVDKVTVSELIIFSGFKKIITGFFVTPVISIILRSKPKK